MPARRVPHGMRAVVLLALLAAVLLALTSCGGAASRSGRADPDPATLAPAGAALYGQVTVRPSGAAKDGAVAAARKVLRVQDPGAELRRLFDKDRTDGIRFSRDVEPWLGPRVGAFLLAPAAGAHGPQWAVLMAIGDRSAFDAALPRLRRGQHRAGSYRGVTYDRDDSDPTTYGAAVGDFYVGGTLAGLRAAIDASHGNGLAGDRRFAAATHAVPDDALAFGYADPQALATSASASSRRALARLGTGPVVGSLTANGDEIAIEAGGALHPGARKGSRAEVRVSQLPGDAWLALATPPLGPLVRGALDAAGVHARAAAQVRARLGLDLDRDLLDPLGGLGMFVRGESLLDIGGGVLLQLTNPAAAQLLLTRVEALAATGLHVAPHPVAAGGARGFELQLPQAPQPLVVLAKGDRLAAGYAASSAQDLLAPQQRLDESSAGRAAIATLGPGYTPSFVLVVPPLAALLRSIDQLQLADLSSVLPYVDAYRSLAIGTKRDGDRMSVRIVAALR
ncbi:MAG: DUF3352 domain-containing protein [Actinobacteria bacterium]|nr:DUF3352 domain-containing protein [Actinomycetota bacterium]